MPIQKEQNENIVDDLDNSDVEELDETDYGFIIGANGELKSIMFPELIMEDPPKEIKKILKIYGIKDIHDMVEKTIH